MRVFVLGESHSAVPVGPYACCGHHACRDQPVEAACAHAVDDELFIGEEVGKRRVSATRSTKFLQTAG